MDIIIIAKKTHNRNDEPHVVYCGQDRNEAAAAVQASAGKFTRYYELNPEPQRPLPMPAVKPQAAQPATPTPEPEPPPTPEPAKPAIKPGKK